MKTIPAEIDPYIFKTFEGLKVTHAQALAEFIDNSIQSWLDNKSYLESSVSDYKLKIDIKFEWGETEDRSKPATAIIIKDNAFGLNETTLESAFITARRKTPINNSSLNEFGMGMKTMGCWFCNKMTMRTLSSDRVLRTVVFNKEQLINNQDKTISVNEDFPVHGRTFTEIKLEELTKQNLIYKNRLNKIKKALESIYRKYLRNDEIRINFNDEPLEFNDYEILTTPSPNGNGVDVWREPISYTLFGKRITGFIGVLKEMKSGQNGFVLLRRGRVIAGEDTDNRLFIRPLSTDPGSPRGKRIFGEFELEGFDSTFNKNGVAQDSDLNTIFEKIAELQTIKPLLKQAQDYRKVTFKINAVASPVEGGFISGAGEKNKNSKVTLKVSPAAEYRFVKWSDGDIHITKTFNATENITLTAFFEKIETGQGEGTQTTGQGEGSQTTGQGEGTQTTGQGEGTQTTGQGEGTQTTGQGEGTQTTNGKPTHYPDGAIFERVGIKANNVNYGLYIKISHNQNNVFGEPSSLGSNITIRFNNKLCKLDNPDNISDEYKEFVIIIAKAICKTFIENGNMNDFLENINK